MIQNVFFSLRYVERRALTPLFDRNPLLGGKFYKLLALGLLRRVRALVNQTQFLKTLNFEKKKLYCLGTSFGESGRKIDWF